jgi:hypothetical protein
LRIPASFVREFVRERKIAALSVAAVGSGRLGK